VDSLSLGGYLGGFLIAGILLPLSVSFILDGVVMYFRGRGPFRLFVTSALTLALVGLYVLACQNALLAGSYDQMASSIGLILWFSVGACALGFAVRMLALFLNPTTKSMDQAAIENRQARREAHHSARAEAKRARPRTREVTRHA
jgi:hypothetical protein